MTAYYKIGMKGASRKMNAMARKLRHFKRQGASFSFAVDYAIRSGMTRSKAVTCARMAFRQDPQVPTATFVQGGRVSPR